MFFCSMPFVYDRAMDGVSAFVLAGGKSVRMGTDKAFVEFSGTTLLARALKLLGEISGDVWIVGSLEKFAPFGRVVEDEFPDHGPLGGIHAALRASDSDFNFVLAVDLPFVEVSLVKYLLGQAQRTKAMVTVARAGGGWQPLCAIYRKPFAEVAERALQRSANKIDPLFGQVKVRVVQETELKKANLSSEMFRNLNTPEELSTARRD
jgi:molybdenum cofactor guanylyltransferase